MMEWLELGRIRHASIRELAVRDGIEKENSLRPSVSRNFNGRRVNADLDFSAQSKPVERLDCAPCLD
jgi:hypothetical protein